MKFRKAVSLMSAMVMILCAFSACGAQADEIETETSVLSDAETEYESEEADGEYVPVTIENYNRTVEFTEKPERVVVLTLNSAEIVAALGEADSIVAIARNCNTVEDILPEYYDDLKDCDFPDEVNNGIPTLESILSLDPDLVICNSYYFNAPQIFGTLEDYEENGIQFYITEGSYVTNCTIENTYNDIRNISAIFGKEDEAEALIDSMEERLETVATTVDGQESLRVMSFDSMNEDEFTVAGGVGLAQYLIEAAGGTNIFSDTDSQFLSVSIEEIIARDPEVIVIHAYTYLGDEDAQGKIDYLYNTAELSEVTAIKNNNIIVVPLFQVNPSIQNVDYVESLAAAMYPELFE